MTEPLPLGWARSLAGFDLRQVPLYRFDLVVLGAGAAGGSAALAAAAAGAQVALVTKRELREGNTRYAMGGVAAAVGPEDSIESHVADTLEVGRGLSEPEVVERVVRGGPDAIERLLALGTDFDRAPSGELARSREGGHGHARVLHARGDATGHEIQRALEAALRGHPRIHLFEHTFAIDLLRADDGAVCGALAATARGERVGFTASEVVLSTGGAGQLYRETTNPAIATGDGVALAFRAGAAVRDLEFFQFHPTCLYIAGAARALISEVVRGHGGVLRDRHGERFMPAYHPDAELAPRDVVSRAAFERMVATDDTSVYLDLTDISEDPHALFPSISRTCRTFGIDIARDPIPVRPGQHYQIGGVESDLEGRTSIEGLRAVGECASSGLHGANRMGSNSLLEGLVLGEACGRSAAGSLHDVRRGSIVSAPEPEPIDGVGEVHVNVEDVTYSLKSLMWRQMGVERHATKLEDAVAKVELWRRAVRGLAPAEPRTWELLNMLDVARLAVVGALAREESRGVHWRTDHPEEVGAWQAHTRLEPVGETRVDAVRVVRRPVGEAAVAR